MQAMDLINGETLTVEQVAQLTQVKRQTVYAWIKSGRLQALRAGQRILTTREALATFIENGSEATPCE